MANFLLGFQVLFRTWTDARFADQVRATLEGRTIAAVPPPTPGRAALREAVRPEPAVPSAPPRETPPPPPPAAVPVPAAAATAGAGPGPGPGFGSGPLPGHGAGPGRSEALTLLGILQREGRFLDFLMETVEGYSDAEIGAAVRPMHKECASIVRRVFEPQPLVNARDEGFPIEVPPGFDPAQYRLVGNVPTQPPFRGSVVHPGWKAQRCELPSWNGRKESASVIAPAEVEFA